jgi:hypothetical protein
MLSVARGASADESVDTGAMQAVYGFTALDLGLATTDLVFGARATWAPRWYGALEVAAAGAQLAICLDKVLAPQRTGIAPGTAGEQLTNSSSTSGMWQVGAAFGAIFLAHGIVTLVAPRAHADAPTERGPVDVAPLALSDAARQSVPGLAVLGRF